MNREAGHRIRVEHKVSRELFYLVVTGAGTVAATMAVEAAVAAWVLCDA